MVDRKPASPWSIASWAFFGLTALAVVGAGAWWAALRPVAEDPRAGPVAGVFVPVGVGAAWLLALACASVGTLCGLIGVASPAGRSGPAWGAVALNGAFVAVSLVLLLILSP
jgi:hypothetical protein